MFPFFGKGDEKMICALWQARFVLRFTQEIASAVPLHNLGEDEVLLSAVWGYVHRHQEIVDPTETPRSLAQTSATSKIRFGKSTFLIARMGNRGNLVHALRDDFRRRFIVGERRRGLVTWTLSCLIAKIAGQLSSYIGDKRYHFVISGSSAYGTFVYPTSDVGHRTPHGTVLLCNISAVHHQNKTRKPRDMINTKPKRTQQQTSPNICSPLSSSSHLPWPTVPHSIENLSERTRCSYSNPFFDRNVCWKHPESEVAPGSDMAMAKGYRSGGFFAVGGSLSRRCAVRFVCDGKCARNNNAAPRFASEGGNEELFRKRGGGGAA